MQKIAPKMNESELVHRRPNELAAFVCVVRNEKR